jgi:hypothetical protein
LVKFRDWLNIKFRGCEIIFLDFGEIKSNLDRGRRSGWFLWNFVQDIWKLVFISEKLGKILPFFRQEFSKYPRKHKKIFYKQIFFWWINRK